MKRWTAILPIILLQLAWTGCNEPIMDKALLGVVWRVVSPQTPEEQIVPGPDTLMVLLFFDDTRIGADTPCNNYSGTYKVNNQGSFAIAWQSWTEMACIGRPGILEGRFINALNNVSDYDVSDSGLTLYDSDRYYVVKLSQE